MDQLVLANAIRKAARRLVPFAFLLYLLSYIDRVNIGFAALTMNKDLGFSPSVFGLGASMFFVGYVLFEVPSNLALASVGPRRWIACIMMAWGVISTSMCFVKGVDGFYIVRFLLGTAEAGFFPGIIYFLTQWFPAKRRGRMIAVFMVGQSASGVFGGPISTLVLSGFDHVAGLTGWQWMFIFEGVPTVIVGMLCLYVLVDKPSLARWLTPEERGMLQSAMDEEARQIGETGTHDLLQGLLNPRIYVLSTVFFMIASSIYGSIFWVPQIVKSFGVSTLAVGFITALPYLIASIVSVLWAHDSDRRQERIWHLALPALLSCLGFVTASIWLHTPVIAMIGLSAACVGMYSALPVFWTLPTSFLTGRAAAGGLALIISLGNLSGVVAPATIGWVRQHTGGFGTAMLVLACASLVACLLAFTCRPPAGKRLQLADADTAV